MVARRCSRAVVLLALASACGQGAPPAGGSDGLPSALVGPFRLLRKGAKGKSAPQVLTTSGGKWFNPSALDLDGAQATLPLAMYVDTGDPRSIVRFELPFGPSVAGAGASRVSVLTASLPWEGKEVAHPFAMRVGDEVWLYYAASGCVGRAVSKDGLSFEKHPDPVLCGNKDAAPWENGALTGPAVYRARDGSYRLLYESGGQIGEATSPDGVVFVRTGAPLLSPAPSAEPFDDVAVGDPHPLLGQTPEGEPVTYVYYTGTSSTKHTGIGLAARFGDAGPLVRAVQPVLTRYEARSPSVIRNGPVTLLYAGGRTLEASDTSLGGVVGAIAPATTELPGGDAEPPEEAAAP